MKEQGKRTWGERVMLGGTDLAKGDWRAGHGEQDKKVQRSPGTSALFLLSRGSDGVPSISSDLDTPWMEPR